MACTRDLMEFPDELMERHEPAVGHVQTTGVEKSRQYLQSG